MVDLGGTVGVTEGVLVPEDEGLVLDGVVVVVASREVVLVQGALFLGQFQAMCSQ